MKTGTLIFKRCDGSAKCGSELFFFGAVIRTFTVIGIAKLTYFAEKNYTITMYYCTLA